MKKRIEIFLIIGILSINLFALVVDVPFKLATSVKY